MAQQWWVRERGESLGPYSARDLKTLAEAGRIHAETPVRSGDQGKWVRADRVGGLLPTQPDIQSAAESQPTAAPAARPAPTKPAPSISQVVGDDFGGDDFAPAAPASDFPTAAPADDFGSAAPTSDFPTAEPASDFPAVAPVEGFADVGGPSAGTTSVARARGPRRKPKTDSTKIIGIVCAVIAFAGAFAASFNLVNGTAERKMKKVEERMNKTLPTRVDHVTTLDRVKAGPGKTFSYYYTVANSVSRSQLRGLDSEVRRRAFATKEMKPIFAAGVTLKFKYYNKSGKKLHEITVKR